MTIDEIEIKRAYWDRKFERELKRFFTAQGKAIYKLSRITDIKQFERQALKQVEQDTPKLNRLYVGLYTGIVTAFGTAVYNELVGKKIFSLFALGIYSWIATMAQAQGKKLNFYTLLTIKNIVKRGIEEGKSVNDIAKTIRAVYLERFSVKRSKRIARTEVNSASNYGSWAGAKQTGLTLKKIWVSTKDSRTRKTHRRAGQKYQASPIGLDEMFIVGKGKLKYPGDPSGPPEEVINCRCAVGYRRM
jgi:hypothetical protein